MSFGFSISDIIKLIDLTSSTYNGWKNACGTYATITDNLGTLRTLLQRIETEVKAPNSLFSGQTDDLHHWASLSRGCFEVVSELAHILEKYKSLSTSRARNWDRIRLGNMNIEHLNTRLIIKIESVGAFATVMGISSQGRVETMLLPELLRKMDDIAAEIRKGTSSIGTMTTYENDDKSVWNEFRREMIKADVKSRDLHRYKHALKTYVLRLKKEGLLDEEGIVGEDLCADHEGDCSDEDAQSVETIRPGERERMENAPDEDTYTESVASRSDESIREIATFNKTSNDNRDSKMGDDEDVSQESEISTNNNQREHEKPSKDAKPNLSQTSPQVNPLDAPPLPNKANIDPRRTPHSTYAASKHDHPVAPPKEKEKEKEKPKPTHDFQWPDYDKLGHRASRSSSSYGGRRKSSPGSAAGKRQRQQQRQPQKESNMPLFLAWIGFFLAVRRLRRKE